MPAASPPITTSRSAMNRTLATIAELLPHSWPSTGRSPDVGGGDHVCDGGLPPLLDPDRRSRRGGSEMSAGGERDRTVRLPRVLRFLRAPLDQRDRLAQLRR